MSPVSLSGSLGASVGLLKLGGPGGMFVVGFGDVQLSENAGTSWGRMVVIAVDKSVTAGETGRC